MSNMLRAPRALRSTSSSSLDIGSSPQLPPGKLPSVKDVLKLICYHIEQPKAAKKGISDFCCTSSTVSKEAECLQEGGCIESGKPCLAFKVKKPYLMVMSRRKALSTICNLLNFNCFQHHQNQENITFGDCLLGIKHPCPLLLILLLYGIV